MPPSVHEPEPLHCRPVVSTSTLHVGCAQVIPAFWLAVVQPAVVHEYVKQGSVPAHEDTPPPPLHAPETQLSAAVKTRPLHVPGPHAAPVLAAFEQMLFVHASVVQTLESLQFEAPAQHTPPAQQKPFAQ